MTTIGFVGLGHMGAPMAQNLVDAGFEVRVFDVSPQAVAAAVAEGANPGTSVMDVAGNCDIFMSMLPEGKHVEQVYLGPEGAFSGARKGVLFIDCSTIDVETSRFLNREAADLGFEMLDAPVSGGVKGAREKALTFMVGGSSSAFERGRPFLEKLGAKIIHVGAAGSGQAVKICNNLVLGISMVAVSEAFLLGRALGVDDQTLFDVMSKSSAQCWSLTSYAPVPGVVPTSPANNHYEAGFSATMMLKDLKLSQKASKHVATSSPLGHSALELYESYCKNEETGKKDFSSIINFLQN